MSYWLTNYNQSPAFRALRKRYQAGLRAVRAGADPYQTLYYVLWPTQEVEKVQEMRRAA